MMLMLTEIEIARLSPQLRAELLRVMFGSVAGGQESADVLEADDPTALPVAERYIHPPQHAVADDVLETKVVVELNVEQSRRLISNISDKSKETLKRFAIEGAVSLDDLVGPGCPYSDMTDLKRSFVGAVNRRLRTVTKNRFAALLKRSRSDDRRIEVKGRTAWSLREAMGLPEPLPEMLAYIARGNELIPMAADVPAALSGAAESLRSRIDLAWKTCPDVRAMLAKGGTDQLPGLALLLGQAGLDLEFVSAPFFEPDQPIGHPFLALPVAQNGTVDESAFELTGAVDPIGLGVRDPAFPEVVVLCSFKERI